MSKPEWGKKRLCQDCGAKYYDLQSETPTCPKCGVVFQPETYFRSSGKAEAAPLPVKEAAKKSASESEEDQEEDVGDSNGDDDIIGLDDDDDEADDIIGLTDDDDGDDSLADVIDKKPPASSDDG